LLPNECLLLLFISLSNQSGNFRIHPRILLGMKMTGLIELRISLPVISDLKRSCSFCQQIFLFWFIL